MRQASEFLAVNEGVALFTGQCAQRQVSAAVVAMAGRLNQIIHGLGTNRAHVLAGFVWNGPMISIFGAPVRRQAIRMPTRRITIPSAPLTGFCNSRKGEASP